MEAKYKVAGDEVKLTAEAVLVAGQVIDAGGGRAGVMAGLNNVAIGEVFAAKIKGFFELAAASASAWADGAHLFWDDSGAVVVAPDLAVLAAADLYIGRAVGAKTSGQTTCWVDLNAGRDANYLFPVIMDCATGEDANTHVMVPANLNPHGGILRAAFGQVTEQFAGTEDQGIVLIEDSDGTDLCSITAADSGADAVGDIVQGHQLDALSSGAAGVAIAAGKGITCRVSQATTGSAAGKFKVCVEFIPLG